MKKPLAGGADGQKYPPGDTAAVAAATVAACQSYPYGSSRYDYGPGFERVPGYQPGQANGSSSWKRPTTGTIRAAFSGPEMYP